MELRKGKKEGREKKEGKGALLCILFRQRRVSSLGVMGQVGIC